MCPAALSRCCSASAPFRPAHVRGVARLAAHAEAGKKVLSPSAGAVRARADAPRRSISSNAAKEAAEEQRNLILEILLSKPSLRDSRSYLASFAPRPPDDRRSRSRLRDRDFFDANVLARDKDRTAVYGEETGLEGVLSATGGLATDPALNDSHAAPSESVKLSSREHVEELLQPPIQSHTGLVKIQGPFTDRQLASIAEGMVYLKKLGLVSVIVVDSEQWPRRGSTQEVCAGDHGDGGERKRKTLREQMVDETYRIVDMLEAKGGNARPMMESVVRLSSACEDDGAVIDDLKLLRYALANDQIPVIPPFAVDASLQSVCVSADDVMVALSRGLCEAGRRESEEKERRRSGWVDNNAQASTVAPSIDLTPVRLMIINREGGIPAHSRGGNPHLSINLRSEYDHILRTFLWQDSHPTSLSNLCLARDCLEHMPRTSSGVIVSHRSPKSLIGNLITNKAAHSPSLPQALLSIDDPPPSSSSADGGLNETSPAVAESTSTSPSAAVASAASSPLVGTLSPSSFTGALTGRSSSLRHIPTMIRHGLPVRVIRDFSALDFEKLTTLLETSFRRRLDREAYYARLERDIDFVIVAGDEYEGAAIVTSERGRAEEGGEMAEEPLAYLDKFAVLPSLQGDGTVDFLWGALRDESFGLGLQDALNDNGGLGGLGKGRDLVWKSRSENPVNRWYWERSSGFVRIHTDRERERRGEKPGWSMFWCDAEDRIARMVGERRGGEGDQRLTGGLPVVAEEEHGRLERWARVLSGIPSAWK